MANDTKTYIQPGEVLPVIGSYSEAMCHCGHAGLPVGVELVAATFDGRTYYSGAVHKNGQRYTGFTTGEVGIMSDDGGHYVRVRAADDKGDANPKAVQAELTAMILAACS